MENSESEEGRAETLIAALLYLMTHYARTGCPRLALYVSRHLQCLACHGLADPVVRDACAALYGAWASATEHSPHSNQTTH